MRATTWPSQFQHANLSRRTDDDMAQLALILPDAFAISLESWVTMHEDLRDGSSCRVTFDALVNAMSSLASPESRR